MKFLLSFFLLISTSAFAQSVPTQDELSTCYFAAYSHITKNWLGLELSEEDFKYRANFVMSRTGLKKNPRVFNHVGPTEILGKGRKFKQGLTIAHPFFNEQYGFGNVSAEVNAKLAEGAEAELVSLPECVNIFEQNSLI